jgi:uncharacterized membrane protein
MSDRVSGRPGRTRHAARAALLLTALALVAGPGAPLASAAVTGVTTPFPSIVAEPGDTASFALTIRTDAAEAVELSTAGVPAGWSARFSGEGLTVGSAYVTPGNPVEVDLNVDIPDDAAAGDTRIEVRARTGGTTETLPLTIRVEEQAAGAVTLTSDFPELTGPASGSYSFNLTLDNDTPTETTFSMNAVGPEGWVVTAQPAGQSQATSTVVAAGGSESITVEAEPPADIEAGSYPIRVTVSGGGETVTADLAVSITGSYSLDVSTANEVLSTTANAGSPTTLQVTITNTGTAPITEVSPSGNPPTGWEVTFDPESIPTIAAGATETVTATITPTGDAITGDYNVILSVDAAEASGDVTIRVKVETPAFWWIAGLALIAVVFAGLWWVFRTYGRR